MINIRRQSLQTLEQITLPDFFDRVDIKVSARNIDRITSNDVTPGYYKLSNGININIVSERSDFEFLFTDKQSEILDATKWFGFDDYDKLKEIVSSSKTEPGFASERDYAAFNVFTSVIDGISNNQQAIKQSLFSTQAFGYKLFRNDNFEGVFIASLDTNDSVDNTHVFSRDYISSSDLSGLFKSRSGIRPSSIFTKGFVDVGLEKFAIDEYREGSNDFSIYFYSPYRGHRTRYAIPQKVLTDYGIEVGTCIMSNEPVVAHNAVYSMSLASNAFGSILPRLESGLFLSRDLFNAEIEDYECSDCGDSYSVINSDFAERLLDLIPEGRDRDVIQSDIESHYRPSNENSDFCVHCERRQARAEADLKRIGIQLSGSTFTYKDAGYRLQDGSGIHSYDYKPDDFEFFYLPDESPTDLLLGVEIEVDDGGESSQSARLITSVLNKDILDEYTYAMHDGSLSDGFEIATMPSSLLFHMNKVNYKDAFSLASALGYRSHDTSSCGLHVHMNRRFFGSSRATQNIKAAFMALILERNWDEVVKFSRRNYRHIEEWANKKDLNYNVYDDDTADDIASKFLDSYDDKYVALNTQHRNSFELRIFRGTLRYETYIATLQFVSNLANIAKSCTTLTRAQQISFADIINYQRYPELTNYLATRGMFVESDDAPVIQAQPTLFDAVAQ